eukprot:ANDGO_07229.mRNA.1 hypothetical protein
MGDRLFAPNDLLFFKADWETDDVFHVFVSPSQNVKAAHVYLIKISAVSSYILISSHFVGNQQDSKWIRSSVTDSQSVVSSPAGMRCYDHPKDIERFLDVVGDAEEVGILLYVQQTSDAVKGMDGFVCKRIYVDDSHGRHGVASCIMHVAHRDYDEKLTYLKEPYTKEIGGDIDEEWEGLIEKWKRCVAQRYLPKSVLAVASAYPTTMESDTCFPLRSIPSDLALGPIVDV